MAVRFGIDLGGTKVEIIALDDNGKELLRKRRPTPKGDYEGTVNAIAGLVGEARSTLGTPGTVGLGIPGAISPATGLVKNANSTWLNGKPFDKDLQAALGTPVRIANDADCLAVSEATDGAGAGQPIVWAIIIGTGAGSGIVAHGKVVTGPNAIGGEWGHNPLPWASGTELPGPDCYCGKQGCNETFVSGTGLARDHRKVTGQDIKGPEIVARAAQGDDDSQASLTRYTDRLARATAAVINILDPDVIVLGGGMSNYKPLYTELPKLWPQYVFSDTVSTALKPSVHGDSSGVRGAAWLWPKE